VSGGAPEAMVIPYRVAGQPFMGQAEDEALAKCIYHCIGLRANSGIDIAVMSISLGGINAGTKKKIKDALAAAQAAGIVMVAAAGQLPGHGWGNRMPRNVRGPTFPGSSPHTICVAGCDWEHKPLRMACYGKKVDVSGPAVNVWMSRTKWVDSAPDGEAYRVERSEGTSYSTALTAAACALWQSFHTREKLIRIYGRPRLHAAFRYCLRRTADRRAGWNTDERGAGALDAGELLDLRLPSVEDVDRQAP
jgi:serine protease